MSSETTIVATQVRLHQWMDQIRECQNRPIGVKVEEWCAQNGITKANYYYRLRRVRKACLDAAKLTESSFIELPIPKEEPIKPCRADEKTSGVSAVIRADSGLSLEILDSATPEFLRKLLGVINHAE